MPALLPIVLAASYLSLVADVDKVPKLNYEPSCRAAAAAGMFGTRNMSTCARDEETARAKLDETWTKFDAADRARCVRLTMIGGAPSYVEVLTCLEMARDSKNIPDYGGNAPPIDR